jgi:hypothetical protein
LTVDEDQSLMGAQKKATGSSPVVFLIVYPLL